VAKPHVVDPSDGSRVPFLRGILTRSLQECGLSFDDAYRVATGVRAEVAHRGEVERAELRTLVEEWLEPFGDDVAELYLQSHGLPPTVRVRGDDGSLTPFSRAQHALGLECCGLSQESAHELAAGINALVAERGVLEVSELELRRATHERLVAIHGDDLARDYLVWETFRQSGRSLFLLIGGITGSGKTTVATQVAHTLQFMRTQSTDMLREVMRTIMPQHLLPVLHRHSYDAWAALPARERNSDEDLEALVADGYLAQAELLTNACAAAVSRAMEERVSIILEGVHVHPTLAARLPRDQDSVVVSLLLAILKPDALRKRLRGRGRATPARAAKRYLEHFDDLWRLQSFLLDEAERHDIPIVVNQDRERTVREVMRIITRVVDERLDADPEAVLEA